MRRRHAVLDSAAALTPFGHAGWGYRDRGEFFSRAAERRLFGWLMCSI
jgi:hypothetical protein